MQIGIDTGGTFTDFALLSNDGRLAIHKVASTPAETQKQYNRGISSAGGKKR